MIEQADGQMSLFDLDTWSGKTSPAHSQATEEKISDVSLRKQPESSIVTPMFLDLRGGLDGTIRGLSWDMDGLSLGEFTTRSFGEYPSDERESRLSQILEEQPLPKYYLSAKACLGILRRAEKRGKELPEELLNALVAQSHSKNAPDVRGGKGILIQHERTGALSTLNNQAVMF